jgi:hypothetical protein
MVGAKQMAKRLWPPEEPTPEMIEAAVRALTMCKGGPETMAFDVWQAMLDAWFIAEGGRLHEERKRA